MPGVVGKVAGLMHFCFFGGGNGGDAAPEAAGNGRFEPDRHRKMAQDGALTWHTSI